jgi:hypothetical protein
MIRNVTIKNTATFNDTGIEVPEFKKVNFFYGANGSGKTTFSNFIYEPSNTRFPDCQLNWQNDIELKSLVYNKEFRDRNFGNGTIAGVFTLGQATKEEAELIEEKRNERKELKEKGIQQKEVLDKQTKKRDDLEDDFREEVWTTIYKKHEVNFKEAFKGVMQKKPFLIKLLDEFENNTSDLKTIEELKERAETILGETPIKIPEIPTIDFLRISEIEQEDIWTKKIILKTNIIMKQKKIWMPFLIIGISIVFFNSISCSKDTMEQLKSVSYIYRNESNNDLVMRVYNNSNDLIKSFGIPSNSEMISNTTISEGGLSLFYFDSDINNIGDSIIVEFETNKCLYFSKNNNDKIFIPSMYNNYTEELLELNNYSLKYIFTEDDYNQAIDCN